MKTRESRPGEDTAGRSLFWAIIGLGVFVRIVYYLQIKDSFLFQTPILDAKYYHDWALEIARGDLLGRARGVFVMSPGYSYALALVYRVFGVDVSAVVLLQFLSGIVSGALVYAIAKKHFSAAAATVAMALYLLYAPGLFFESTLLKAALINCLNLAAMYLALAAGPLSLGLSGLLVGVSAQLRPNVLLLVPIVLVYIAGRRNRVSAGLAAFVAGLVIALLPVAARNYAVGGEFVMTTAHGGMNLYTGNSEHCLGPYTPIPFARADPAFEQADFQAEANRLTGRRLTPSESSRFWIGESLKYIAAHPAAWLRLVYRKALIFANDYEPQINLNFYFFKQQYDSILSLIPVTYGTVFPLGLTGMVFGRAGLLLGGYALVYLLSGVVFFVVSEYRFPIVPVLCIYAGVAVTGLFQRLFSRKNKAALAMLALAGLLAWVSNRDIYAKSFGFDTYKRSNLAMAYFGMGATYQEHGRLEDAKRSYHQAIEIMPLIEPLFNLAGVYEREGRHDMALALNEEVLKHHPGNAEALNNIGAILYKRREHEKAAKYFRAALASEPGFTEAQKNLEAALTDLGSR